MLNAVVLAAGSSRRMGSPKALLATPDGRVFITCQIDTLQDAGLTGVTVVTGVHHDAIASACALYPNVRCVRNPDPDRGQLSSLITAMDAVVTSNTSGLLVSLVDVPMVKSGTVRRLVEEWRARRAPIVRPSVGETHGHPVIFDRAVFTALREAPLDSGAKAVFRLFGERVHNVPVDDRGCLMDVDTPADYARIMGS